MLLFFLSVLWSDAHDVRVIKTYETPVDEYLGVPYSMAISPEGRMYVVDRNQSRILVWNQDGSFRFAFGKKGRGPGETLNPVKIVATAETVYIWDSVGQVSVFDHEGHFQKWIRFANVPPRNFAVLHEDLFLLGYMVEGPTETWNYFSLRNGRGEEIKILKKFRNESQLSVVKGESTLTAKPYAPEVDIQKGPGGHWYFGFSQNRLLHEVDKSGSIVATHRFQIPTGAPTEKEKASFLQMSFPMPDGTRLAMKDETGLKWDWSYHKAYYTHFLIRGGKVAFVLTPIGSSNILNAYSFGFFYVNDFQSGEVLARGSYAYPEDSRVFYRDGHMVAFVMDEHGEFKIQEILLKGL